MYAMCSRASIGRAPHHGDAAAGRLHEPGDEVQDGRLAAAAPADEHDELASADVQVEVGDRKVDLVLLSRDGELDIDAGETERRVGRRRLLLHVIATLGFGWWGLPWSSMTSSVQSHSDFDGLLDSELAGSG